MKKQITLEERVKRINAAIAALPAARGKALRAAGDALLRVDSERLPAACVEIEAALKRARFEVISNTNDKAKTEPPEKVAGGAINPDLGEVDFREMLWELRGELSPRDYAELIAELPYLAARAKIHPVARERKVQP